jgi:glycerol-3-phosphate acyltransferase PlsY
VWFGVPVVVLDTAKGFVPALVFSLTLSPLAGVLAGAGAMLGHARPLFLKFERGGKMVATTGGAFLGVAPLVAAVGAVVWLVVFLVFRYASLASMVGAVSLPIAAVVLGYSWSVIAFAAFAAAGVLFLHRANVRRLWRGEESRVVLRRRAKPPVRAAPSSGRRP